MPLLEKYDCIIQCDSVCQKKKLKTKVDFSALILTTKWARQFLIVAREFLYHTSPRKLLLVKT